MRDFKKLQVWQKSHRLVLEVYGASGAFPESERFGLTSQMRRAAVSIAANLAEGYGRHTDREFLRFVHISSGSATELEYHLLLASDLGYLAEDTQQNLTERVVEVQRMLAGLIRRLRSSTE
jgi:four helix bundle protein